MSFAEGVGVTGVERAEDADDRTTTKPVCDCGNSLRIVEE